MGRVTRSQARKTDGAESPVKAKEEPAKYKPPTKKAAKKQAAPAAAQKTEDKKVTAAATGAKIVIVEACKQ